MGWGSAPCPGHLYPRERPATHCTRGWAGPRSGLERCTKSRPRTGIRSPDRPARRSFAIPTELPGPQCILTGINLLLVTQNKGRAASRSLNPLTRSTEYSSVGVSNRGRQDYRKKWAAAGCMFKEHYGERSADICAALTLEPAITRVNQWINWLNTERLCSCHFQRLILWINCACGSLISHCK